MSIRQFYRTPIPMVATASYRDNLGQNFEYITPIVQPLGNLQPVKQGLVQNMTTGGYVFNNLWAVYLRNYPQFDWEEAEGITDYEKEQATRWAWVEGGWHKVMGEQDWTHAGRAVKHYKLFLEEVDTQTLPDGLDGLTPIPLRGLVIRWNDEVNELTQITNILNKE